MTKINTHVNLIYFPEIRIFLLDEFMVKTLRKIRHNKAEFIVLLVLVFELIFPQYGLAAIIDNKDFSDLTAEEVAQLSQKVFLIRPIKICELSECIELEVEPEVEIIDTYNIPITAYSSTPDQTDSTPCITANGYDLCEANEENIIAANFLPFGTKVRIPEYFGDRIFTVQDRMNARYYYKADIWMKTRQPAMEWGLVYATIEVVE